MSIVLSCCCILNFFLLGSIQLSACTVFEIHQNKGKNFKISTVKYVCAFVCLDAFHEGKKTSVPFFRDLSSRPGVGICNTTYQDLPTYVEPGIEQTGQFNPNTTTNCAELGGLAKKK